MVQKLNNHRVDHGIGVLKSGWQNMSLSLKNFRSMKIQMKLVLNISLIQLKFTILIPEEQKMIVADFTISQPRK